MEIFMNNKPKYEITDLMYLMQCLRDPKFGCPWDLKQTYKSITSSTLEEAYEVVDAIEKEDFAHLKEELGDLLFQTIFYSQLAREEQKFDFYDVVDQLVQKLIRRHPHVFPSGELKLPDANSAELDESQVKQNWESIKQQERTQKGNQGILADVPVTLPAVTRAVKLQKRAAQIGFDWPDRQGVLTKLNEEIKELKEAIDVENSAKINEEFGDLLFTCVNLARHLKVDPEAALRSANQKFVTRFECMERQAELDGTHSLDALNDLWEKAKTELLPQTQ
jgi:nucleoside triphosphate diphosphatase